MDCHQVFDIRDPDLNVCVVSIGVAPFQVASSRRKVILFFESTNEFIRAFELIRASTKLHQTLAPELLMWKVHRNLGKSGDN
jgi:hypothetical protein